MKNHKKVLASALSCVLLATTTLPSFAATTTYTDVPISSVSEPKEAMLTNEEFEITLGQTPLLAADDNTKDISRNTYTVTAGNSSSSDLPSNVTDDNPNTIWHTSWDPLGAFEDAHITIELAEVTDVHALRYLTRQNGVINGNITGYEISFSTDGTTFTNPVTGEWSDGAGWKIEIGRASCRERV